MLKNKVLRKQSKHNLRDEYGIFWTGPVLEIPQISYELIIVKMTVLCQDYKTVNWTIQNNHMIGMQDWQGSEQTPTRQ